MIGSRSKRWIVGISVGTLCILLLATGCWYAYMFHLRAAFDRHIERIASCRSPSEQSAAVRRFARWIADHRGRVLCAALYSGDPPGSRALSVERPERQVEVTIEMEILASGVPWYPRSLRFKRARVTIFSERDASVLSFAGKFGVAPANNANH